MLTGKKAIIYYAEAHLSKFNSYIHTIFMPFSILGILIWLSALFKLTPNMAKYFMWKLYYFYGGLYLNINPANTLVQAKLVGEEYKVEIEAEAILD